MIEIRGTFVRAKSSGTGVEYWFDALLVRDVFQPVPPSNVRVSLQGDDDDTYALMPDGCSVLDAIDAIMQARSHKEMGR